MFLQNFCLRTKNIHNFFGDNTQFKPGIETWSRATQKMGFRMDTKKKLIPKGKGMTPYWPPVPTSRGTNQPKRYYRGRKSIKLQLWVLVSWSLQKGCPAPNSLVVSTFAFQVEGSAFDPHRCTGHGHTYVILVFLDESLFQNYWSCLIKCMQICNM